ncbi:MAG: hypothetical protein RR203_07880 [Synergistaceae bacterium]
MNYYVIKLGENYAVAYNTNNNPCSRLYNNNGILYETFGEAQVKADELQMEG